MVSSAGSGSVGGGGETSVYAAPTPGQAMAANMPGIMKSVYEGGDTSPYENWDGEEYTNLFGSKRRKAAKNERSNQGGTPASRPITHRAEKRALKIEAKRGRIGNLKSKAESRLMLAQQGISTGSAGAQIGKGVLGAVSSIFGGGSGGGGGTEASAISQATPTNIGESQQGYMPSSLGEMQTREIMNSKQASDPTYTPPALPVEPQDLKKNKNLPFIIGGAVLLLIVMFMMMKKK
jgi:hypothetical protein